MSLKFYQEIRRIKKNLEKFYHVVLQGFMAMKFARPWKSDFFGGHFIGDNTVNKITGSRALEGKSAGSGR
jgi:hypothetical protein